MTLVARFGNRKVMFLVGDALISVPSWYGGGIALPSIRPDNRAQAQFELGLEEYSPAQLAQKVLILDDRLALGWAGKMESARRVIEMLRVETAGWEDREHVRAALQKIAPTDGSQIELLGWGVDEAGSFNFGIGGASYPSARFDGLRLIGSGTNMALQALENCVALEPPNAEMAGTYALTEVLMFASYLRLWELMDLGPLKQSFGGAYEIVAWDSGKFQKHPGATVCVWSVERDGEDIVTRLADITRYGYVGEHLVVRSWLCEGKKVTTEEVFTASPVDRPLSSQDTPSILEDRPGMAAAWLLNVFVFVLPGAQVAPWTGCLVSYQPDESLLRMNGGELEISQSLQDQLQRFVWEEVRAGRF